MAHSSTADTDVRGPGPGDGWREHRRTDTHTSYRRFNYGSGLRHTLLALVGWIVLFIPNFIYMLYAYFTTSEWLVESNVNETNESGIGMGICRECESVISADRSNCPECGFAPKRALLTTGGLLMFSGAILTVIFPPVGLLVLVGGLLMAALSPLPKPIH